MNFSIWHESLWLPKNISWNDFARLEEAGTRLPRFQDLLYVYPLAGVIYVARLLFEYAIAQPIGRWIGIREQHSDELAKAERHKSISSKTRPPRSGPLAKFSESTWRFSFYLGIFIYGLVILRDVRDRGDAE